jgi:type II restriction/modification system DNA methylase subunit YeeA
MPTFICLVDYDSSLEKMNEFFNTNNYFFKKKQSDFLELPGAPISYRTTEKIKNIFRDNQKLGNVADFKTGITTGDNNIFMRHWFEVDISSISFHSENINESIFNKSRWFPCKSGGVFRKWYGNNDLVVDYENNGYKIKNFIDDNGKRKSTIRNEKYYFKESISWSKISSEKINVRFYSSGFLFDAVGLSAFGEHTQLLYILAFLNSKISNLLLNCLKEGLSVLVGNLVDLPIIFSLKKEKIIINYVNNSIDISREYWDTQETSWNFQKNSLIYKSDSKKIKEVYDNYCIYWKEKFLKLHKNEEDLNKLFIDIYELKNELTPEVLLKDITILKDETEIKNNELVFKRDVIIKQFISYAIGCMFGRYSPDKEGLILANQGETIEDFNQKVTNPSFTPDDDNIIPVLGDEYFKDDVVDRFKEFLRVTFGKETFAENLDFIADALEKNKNETSEQTIRRYFVNQFFHDHCKMYKNRPIYWLFTSGPEKAFNVLIYMHRYNRELLAKMRVDYLHELQSKLETKKTTLITSASDSLEKNRKHQQLIKLNKQLEELTKYDDLLKHIADQYMEIDLDDGVTVIYEKFKGLVAEI